MTRPQKRRLPYLSAPASFSPQLLEKVQSPYQRIEIWRHPLYGNQLYIDGDLQISACDRAYNIALIAPVIAAGCTQRVAILGGGDGGVLHDLLRTAEITGRPLERATLVDIDAEVIRLARRYLRPLCADAFDHPHTELIVGDAFAYIQRARELDAVIYDLTMDPVRAEQSRSAFIAEVIAATAKALRPGGVLSMQCGGENDVALQAEIRAVAARHFTDVVEQRVLVPSYEELWSFLAARKPK